MIEFRFEGIPEIQDMLEQLEDRAMNNRIRRGLRAMLRPFRDALRSRGRSPQYPDKFRSTRTRQHRNPLGMSISPASPLSPIFDRGARPHAIPISKGPFAGVTASHPGMAARPISVPAFEASHDAAARAFEEKFLEGFK